MHRDSENTGTGNLGNLGVSGNSSHLGSSPCRLAADTAARRVALGGGLLDGAEPARGLRVAASLAAGEQPEAAEHGADQRGGKPGPAARGGARRAAGKAVGGQRDAGQAADPGRGADRALRRDPGERAAGRVGVPGDRGRGSGRPSGSRPPASERWPALPPGSSSPGAASTRWRPCWATRTVRRPT